MKALLFLSCLTLAVLPMCKPDTAKTTTDAAAANPASPTEVRAQFTILRDSAESSWQRMMSSDDQKLADVRALLQALKKQPRLAAGLGTLGEQATRLRALRYDRQSMATSALIDRYDAAQDSVLKPLLQLAAPDGNAPTEAIRDHVEHIMKADADVLGYRARYDAAAKAYNAYLRVHQAEFNQMGAKYARLQPLPLFELSQ
ncbi:MAG TPA: hypothetical protein VFO93_09580 [Hymenobacter sp.]|uniref:hypothetical protein n=1 Tax=Hymenobacter sp. TaxID=1898978 RepID=UPI002D80B5E0|nr:hypothetical protein [Hymenobacter sp.]HET9503782.1 hypothetical protein [Hymenobacter sp.]